MELFEILLLISAGLLGGFVAGFIGVGGGIIFAPVLFFYFQSIGVDDTVVTPLTLGSSLYCTFLASIVSAWAQHQKKSVSWQTVKWIAPISILSVWLTTYFVTTQSWYNKQAFQLVFSILLIIVALRMLRKKSAPDTETTLSLPKWLTLGSTGLVTGSVSVAAGVGGGVVMVPSFHRFLHLPIQQAMGTSSGTIIFIAFAGVFGYIVTGVSAPVPYTALGYVDFLTASLLAFPALFTARLGVKTAHRINPKTLRKGFAIFILIVALRMLYGVVS